MSRLSEMQDIINKDKAAKTSELVKEFNFTPVKRSHKKQVKPVISSVTTAKVSE